MRERTVLALVVVLAAVSSNAIAQDDIDHHELTGTITLRQAVHAALTGNPRLAVEAWDARIAEARVVQAGLRPNPELSIEIEDLRLSSAPAETAETWSVRASATPAVVWERARTTSGGNWFDDSEITLSISQIIELGGKRAKRVAAARHETQVALWDYESARADVVAETAQAFTAVLVAQEKVAQQGELVELAHRVADAIAVRVKAGKVSPLDLKRARITLAEEENAQVRATGELNAARVRLAAMWGATSPRFDAVAGRLDDLGPPPDRDALEQEIGRNPDLQRWAAEISSRQAHLDAQRALRVPDATVSLGFKTVGVSGSSGDSWELDSDSSLTFSRGHAAPDRDRDNSLVLGFSIPLPIFDRNQGGIAEAEAMTGKATAGQRAGHVMVFTELAAAYENALAAYDEALSLRETIFPLAEETFDKVQTGYDMGKFGYLEVLESQQRLIENRTAYLDVLGRYRDAVTRLERLTGRSLEEWSKASKEMIDEQSE